MVYTLLVVDDEPYIADSLVSMFEESELELEVHCAYNACGALKIGEKYCIDILLTDIHMPGGIDGLELQKLIRQQWPLCQVIFLTGHNEFEYAQNAIRGGGNDFILKTEDDEVVIQSVATAITMLDDIIHDKEVLGLANAYIERSKPLLRDKFFKRLLIGEASPNINDFKMMGIELDPERDVCMVVGSFHDKLDENASNIPAVITLVHQYLGLKFIIEEYSPQNDNYIWLIQPQSTINQWINDFGFLNATLDTIQNISKNKMGVDVNFIVNSSPCNWSQIESQSNRLRNILRQSQVPRNASVMTDQYAEKFIKYYDIESIHTVRKHIVVLDMLSEWIESGERDTAKEHIEALFNVLKKGVDYHTLTETQMSIGLIFLRYVNDHNLAHELPSKFSNYRIFSITNYKLSKIKEYYFEFVDELSERYQKEICGQTNRLVFHVEQYIKTHLDGDLSLTNLSQLVHLNASYLSRLYKSHTGISISDTINNYKIDKAKSMLQNTYLRINQIGQELGFTNPAHFTRYFKKLTGYSPNEYRSNKAKIIN